MIKLIPIILLLSSCGGGSEDKETPDQQPEPPVIIEGPHLFSYKVTLDSDTRSYSGTGVKVNGILYGATKHIANSPFVASGEIIDNHVRLFSYMSRGLVQDFTDGGTSGLNLELVDEGEIPETLLSDLEGQWFNSPYAGAFGEPVVTLIYDDGMITGTDTTGCIINGEAFESDGVIGLDLLLTDCPQAGDYHGSLRVDGMRITGAVSSEENGFSILYTISK